MQFPSQCVWPRPKPILDWEIGDWDLGRAAGQTGQAI